MAGGLRGEEGREKMKSSTSRALAGGTNEPLCLCRELIDILRGTGLTEVTDKMTCHGTVWILNNQLQDGSWPVWFDGDEAKEKHSFYDRLHSTWVCTQALRERDFKVNQDCVRLWQQHIQEIVKSSNFGKLGYRPDW